MAMNKKYDYNKELRAFSHLNPPVVLPALPVMQFFMKGFYYTDINTKGIDKKRIIIPVKNGATVRAIVYTPETACRKKAPCIVFYHGGGFVYNAAPHHFTLAKKLAAALSAKVFFIDYRLAPKHPFPTAAEDAFYSYRYISENADAFGIDEKKIAVCGDSAGGNLSAVTCLMARDEGVNPPCGQLLLYPFVDDDMTSDSMREFTDTPMCNRKAAVKYNKAYIPQGKYEPKEWFSVVDAKDLGNLPDAYIELAEFDCLRDGGKKYYERLKEAGNKAFLFETKGTMHGYDIATKSEIYSLCMRKRIEFLQEIFVDENKQ